MIKGQPSKMSGHPCVYKTSTREVGNCRSGGTKASVPPRADGGATRSSAESKACTERSRSGPAFPTLGGPWVHQFWTGSDLTNFALKIVDQTIIPLTIIPLTIIPLEIIDLTGPDFSRAGGAMFASPALQRGEVGQQQSVSPVGAAQKSKSRCEILSMRSLWGEGIQGVFHCIIDLL